MRFATITALFAAGALAAPAPQAQATSGEVIAVSDFSVRKTVDNTPTNVNFKINGGAASNLTCTLDNPAVPNSAVTKCGDSAYSFALVKGTAADYAVRLYKELGPGVGLYGQGDVFTYCHTGGLGDLLCSQVAPAAIAIDGSA
ncbi:hypothetical protein MCOR27_010258 [Pyricularia oryzae]|uniref:AA1-like domain-containing protein n=2 Tax=Pyricularia TaxID=48558 RepID=A0ABQ8NZ11_PYRGI|nr:hypothetical protein MCOR01_009649 [Pyricularia oryzae]KAI6303866.1 hypothetical protein MCOR33_001035 [Pyricularia grisea]KAH9437080.1 hypothetical protein MCOR02_000736 [Pyricularia oryzae]KAI6261713.1 hypothetical protein MCOR19_002043 [Pyricularia oryzae]KAI6268191.1 hypothetical protein MCOR27_010258 [Pyricularia oryzae]